MTNTIALFQISTEEDLRFQLDFVGLDLTGRTLKVNVRERATNALKVSLAAPANLTLVGDGNLTVFYARLSMAPWATGEYEADIIDETGGSFTRIMAVRFVYDHPGKLVYGVKGNQADVRWGNNQATVTAIGGVGPPGPSNILTIGAVDTLETGEAATAEISGDAPNQTLSLGLPKGNTGDAATIAVGDVETGAPGSEVEVVNSGTSGAAVFAFTIPAGIQGIQGDQGDRGWAPELAVVADAGRRVLQLVDWVGGEGTKPAIGDYVGATGLVPDIADAVNVRGDQGPPGSVTDGDKGDITVSDGGTAWTVNAARVSQALQILPAPGGRLTLTSETPVLVATVSAATTVYYTPFVHDGLALYSGTAWLWRTFAEMNLTLDATGHVTNTLYDVFAFDDSGTLRIGTGPAWTSGTGRGAGTGTTELARLAGRLTNAVSITLRSNSVNYASIGVGRALYLGTIYTGSAGQTNFIFGGSASGGASASFGLWNAYNRRTVRTTIVDTGASYTYASNTVRPPRGGTGMQAAFVSGVAEEGISFDSVTVGAPGAGYFRSGVGLDATDSLAGNSTMSIGQSGGNIAVSNYWRSAPLLGWHFVTALESSDGSATTITFNSTSSLTISTHIVFEGEF